MIRRPPRSTLSSSSAASDVYKRQERLSTLMNEFFQINYIDESRNIKGQYFNIRTFNFVKYIRLIANADVIHIHSGIKILRIFHIVFSKIMFKKVVLTLH